MFSLDTGWRNFYVLLYITGKITASLSLKGEKKEDS